MVAKAEPKPEEGVCFPLDQDGKRSTTELNKGTIVGE